MAKILCLETATEICSVGLAVDGELVALRENAEGNRHANVLTVLIAEVFAQSGLKMREIDAVALSKGPGSYTSLRVGASAAKGICFALEKPLIAVGTLEALLAGALAELRFSEKEAAETLLVPMIDARRMEVFGAVFDGFGRPVEPGRPIIVENKTFDEFLAQNKNIVLFGSGAAKCAGLFDAGKVKIFDCLCSARHLSIEAKKYFQNKQFEEVAYFEPFYMKPPNITTPAKKS